MLHNLPVVSRFWVAIRAGKEYQKSQYLDVGNRRSQKIWDQGLSLEAWSIAKSNLFLDLNKWYRDKLMVQLAVP